MMSEDVIWNAKLDNGQYTCKVTRLTGYTGQLTVEDTLNNNEIVLDKEVPLAYGAKFGPDMGDVAHWQDLIIKAVDNP